jgi:hypothetical protein
MVMDDRELLKTRLDALLARAPFPDEFKKRKRKADLVDVAYCDLRLYGSRLTRDGVISVLDGSSIDKVPLLEHRMVYFHKKLLSVIDDCNDMQLDTDARLIERLAAALTGENAPPYREERIELFHLGHVPPDSRGLREALDGALRKTRLASRDLDASGKAAAAHMTVIDVYPFDETYSELAARAALQYELVKGGLFPVDLGLSEQGYFRVTGECLRADTAEPLAAAIRRALIEKTDGLLALLPGTA